MKKNSWRQVTGLGIVLSALSMGFWLSSGGANETGAPMSEPAGTGQGQAVATFAGGCFWCMEKPYDVLDGVISTISGYMGGHLDNPTYQQVSSGSTGHAEVVQVTYDPRKITYEQLLTVFWKNVDPTTPDRQFCDRGSQYRPAIFFHNDAQQQAAQASLEALNSDKPFADPIKTTLEPAAKFYPAEEYHQDYYVKNPVRYRFYRFNCGRDQRLQELWGEAH